MTTYYNFTIKDHSDELSAIRIPVQDPAGDGSDLAAHLTARDNIRAAIGALSIGTIYKQSITAFDEVLDQARPSDADAQRESGLQLRYQETAAPFKKGRVTIACPDKPLIATPGTDQVDVVGVSVVNALVALIEANWVSPNGNSIEVQSGWLVGRSN